MSRVPQNRKTTEHNGPVSSQGAAGFELLCICRNKHSLRAARKRDPRKLLCDSTHVPLRRATHCCFCSRSWFGSTPSKNFVESVRGKETCSCISNLCLCSEQGEVGRNRGSGLATSHCQGDEKRRAPSTAQVSSLIAGLTSWSPRARLLPKSLHLLGCGRRTPLLSPRASLCSLCLS